MTKLLTSCVLAACLAVPAAAAASPITYTAARAVGTGSLNLSITTDGTIGALAAGNIVDWLITVTIGPDSFTLQGPLSGNNSQVLILGSALVGSATNLVFDFSAGGQQLALFQSPGIGAGQYFWCVQTNFCYDGAGPGEAIDPYNNFNFTATPYSGQVVIADAATTPVPEPGTMSLLALGGVAIAWRVRRRRRSA